MDPLSGPMRAGSATLQADQCELLVAQMLRAQADLQQGSLVAIFLAALGWPAEDLFALQTSSSEANLSLNTSMSSAQNSSALALPRLSVGSLGALPAPSPLASISAEPLAAAQTGQLQSASTPATTLAGAVTQTGAQTAASSSAAAGEPVYQLEALGERWQIMMAIVYSLTAITSFALNVVTVMVLWRYRRSELRKYLINLSMSDLLMSLFSIRKYSPPGSPGAPRVARSGSPSPPPRAALRADQSSLSGAIHLHLSSRGPLCARARLPAHVQSS